MFMSSTHAIPASLAIPPSAIIALRPDAPLSDAQLSLADRQLRQLARMAEIGMEALEDLRGPGADGKRLNPIQVGTAYDRVTQAVRRTMASEQEVSGLREKRVQRVRHDLLTVKKTAVRQSVERSLITGKPELTRERRERLLADLFSGYDLLGKGTVREIVAQICQDLGVETDLSLWEEPTPIDIALPAGYDWIVPANGDKPYTRVTLPSGVRTRLSFDSPHLAKHGPPKHGNDPPKRA